MPRLLHHISVRYPALEALGLRIGAFSAVFTPAPAPADPGTLNTPKFARRPRGYLWAKSNRPVKVCIWRGGLCKNAAAGASAAR